MVVELVPFLNTESAECKEKAGSGGEMALAKL
jgi:hypothetical protein